MAGYQEVLTDPSYYGQVVTMTYPLVGNYGINFEDYESRKSWVSGFIMREMCEYPSNWRCKVTLDEYLKAQKGRAAHRYPPTDPQAARRRRYERCYLHRGLRAG